MATPTAGLSDVDRAALLAAARALGTDVDTASLDRLGRFLDVLDVWNIRLRLTGERDRQTILRKHAADALAVLGVLPERGLIIDVGSGAGFPGLVLACVRPDLQVVLVEARRRKASFLGDVARTVPLHRVRVVNARAESIVGECASSAQVVVSRALRLDAFLPLAVPLLARGGIIVAMQTPERAEMAQTLASDHGIRLVDVRPYRLPGGEPRALLVFEHGGAPAR